MSNPNVNRLSFNTFIWLGMAIGLILLVPFVAMQFTEQVYWDSTDFILMGSLLFVSAGVYLVAVKGVTRSRKIITAVAVAAVFLYIWAELAVGIFTNWGS